MSPLGSNFHSIEYIIVDFHSELSRVGSVLSENQQTSSNTSAKSQRDTRRPPETTAPSSSSHAQGSGCDFMSPHPIPLAMLASCMSRAPSSPMLRQVTPQLHCMTVGRVCELVDRFVTDRDRMPFQAHPARDLLRRPTMYDPVDNGLPHIREAYQLPELGPPFASHVIRRNAVVAIEVRDDLVNERVAPDLTKDRRAMSTDLLGDNPDTQPSRSLAGNLTTLIERQHGSRCGPLHFPYE